VSPDRSAPTRRQRLAGFSELFSPSDLPAAQALLADHRPWHAVVTSRLGRNPLARRIEIATLYRWTEQAVANGAIPLATLGTAAHPWVIRACELLGVTPIELLLEGDTINSADSRADASSHPAATSPRRLVVRPPAPVWNRDRLAYLLADRLDVVSIRKNGANHPLLLERLREDTDGSVRVLVPVEPWGQESSPANQRLIEALIAAGAVGYCWGWETPNPGAGDDEDSASVFDAGELKGSEDSASTSTSTSRSTSRSTSTNAGRSANANAGTNAETDFDDSLAARSLLENPGRWLIHCTRGRQGAWPGESESQFRDWLLLTVPHPVDLSPLATLRRIVGQRHLIGGGPTIRAGQPVICFSAAPLLDFVAQRTFRSHLGRWDAEPYGLAISRTAAKRLGARPVIYVDPTTDPAIAERSRWRLQPRGTTFDWSREREWRLRGDLDLRHLASDQAIVFVARRQELSHFADSPWPVIALDSLHPLSSAVALPQS
jgi:hypothetical protein